jgi:hypothetical protein
MGQTLRQFYKLANDREMDKALDMAVELRALASELVYEVNELKKS